MVLPEGIEVAAGGRLDLHTWPDSGPFLKAARLLTGTAPGFAGLGRD